MNKAMQVQDVETRISMLVDQELSPQEERNLLQLIHTRPEYQRLLQEAQSLKQLVQQKTAYQSAPPSLHQSIRQQLQNTLPKLMV
jgi:anti-sigma factor RsiW